MRNYDLLCLLYKNTQMETVFTLFIISPGQKKYNWSHFITNTLTLVIFSYVLNIIKREFLVKHYSKTLTLPTFLMQHPNESPSPSFSSTLLCNSPVLVKTMTEKGKEKKIWSFYYIFTTTRHQLYKLTSEQQYRKQKRPLNYVTRLRGNSDDHTDYNQTVILSENIKVS